MCSSRPRTTTPRHANCGRTKITLPSTAEDAPLDHEAMMGPIDVTAPDRAVADLQPPQLHIRGIPDDQRNAFSRCGRGPGLPRLHGRVHGVTIDNRDFAR